jgi:hypothetical protein
MVVCTVMDTIHNTLEAMLACGPGWSNKGGIKRVDAGPFFHYGNEGQSPSPRGRHGNTGDTCIFSDSSLSAVSLVYPCTVPSVIDIT